MIVNEGDSIDLHQKIQELYFYLLLNDKKAHDRQRFRSYVLENLVATENVRRIVINLYPGNKGYSLCYYMSDNKLTSDGSDVTMLPNGIDHHYHANVNNSKNNNLIELFHWPYEIDDLLYYMDNCQIPNFISDILEERVPNVYYSGCVVCEVRDYRQNFLISSNSCDISYVLLKSGNENYFSSIHHFQESNQMDESYNNKFESQLILSSSDPLCLDPDPEVGKASINSKFIKEVFNTHRMKTHMKKFSQVFINRKRKIDQFTNNPNTSLGDYIQRMRQLQQRSDKFKNKKSIRNMMSSNIKYGTAAPPIHLKFPELTPPKTCDVQLYTKSYEHPGKYHNFSPQLIEEYTLETEQQMSCSMRGRIYHIKLSIYQRQADMEFLGELYVDRDYRPDQRNGEACQFVLGSRNNVNKYIEQFTEIFTEEGRKNVKITHRVPGQAPKDISRKFGLVNLTSNQRTNKSNSVEMPSSVHQTAKQNQSASDNNSDVRQNIIQSVPILQNQQCQRQPQILLQHSQQPVSTNNIGIIKTQQVPIIGRNILIPNQQHQIISQPQKISNAAIISLLNSAPAAMTSNPLMNRPQNSQIHTTTNTFGESQSTTTSTQSPNLLSLLQSPQIQIANARVINQVNNSETNSNDTLAKILTIAAAASQSGNRALQNVQIQIPGIPAPIQVTVTDNLKNQNSQSLNQQVSKLQMGTNHISIQKNSLGSTSRTRNIQLLSTPIIRNIAGAQVHSLLTQPSCDGTTTSTGNVIHLIRNPNQVVLQSNSNQPSQINTSNLGSIVHQNPNL